jgi:hypothetical protein
MSASPASGIFISYRRSDTKWFAALLHSRIAGAFPARDVFLDVSKIELGTSPKHWRRHWIGARFSSF